MVQTAIFDLWYILVETVFGSVGASYLAICVLFFIIGFISKMSPMLILMIWILFTATFGIGMYGAFVAVPMFILSFIYFAFNAVQAIRRFI